MKILSFLIVVIIEIILQLLIYSIVITTVEYAGGDIGKINMLYLIGPIVAFRLINFLLSWIVRKVIQNILN